MSSVKSEGRCANPDEIDFVRLVTLVIDYKWFILGVCASAALIFTVINLRQIPVYVAQATIRIDCAPVQQSFNGKILTLSDRAFSIVDWRTFMQDRAWIARIVRKHDLAPLVGKLVNRGKESDAFSVEQAVDIIGRMQKVDVEDEDRMRLQMEGADPALVKRMLDIGVAELQGHVQNDFAHRRVKVLAALKSERQYFVRQMHDPSARIFKDQLAETVILLIGREAVLQNPALTGFQVIHPASEPEERVVPKRWFRLVFVEGFAFLIGMFLVLSWERLKGSSLRERLWPESGRGQGGM